MKNNPNDLFEFHCVGEGAVILYARSGDIREKNKTCRTLTQSIFAQQRPSWLYDVVPSYDSVMLHFDGMNVDQHDVFQWLSSLNIKTDISTDTNRLTLPICYSLDSENDLADIAEYTKLSKDEVVGLHSSSCYQVYAIGFAPGFAYMGFVPEQLAVPRKNTPRVRVPKGAVAIADAQTAIYPASSPGGWNIVGYCPLNLVTPEYKNVSPFDVGQQVGFEVIDANEYKEREGMPWYEANS